VHTLWVPLATWIWLIVLLASACGNRIEWRGNRYRLEGGQSCPQPAFSRHLE